MMHMQLNEAASLMEGRLSGANVNFTGISTDSRAIAPGSLFVALKGERFDGHAFVAKAFADGAAGALVSQAVGVEGPLVTVQDTLAALGALAGAWRRRFDCLLIAVTGSNGKTTVKEMLASILCQAGSVLATRGNLNNEIGVPLTLSGLNAQHRAAVVEMGANHAGEIARLTEMAAPSVGVVTLCAPAHIEGFRSLEGVAAAKGELFAGLPHDAIAVLNVDDAFASMWRELIGTRRTVTFGSEHRADIWSSRRSDDRAGCFNLHIEAQSVAVRLQLLGLHNIQNALAAAAAAHACGITPALIAAGLSETRPVAGRLLTKTAFNGATLIDDSYNANPYSVRAAIEVLVTQSSPRWFAFGDMAELGAGAKEEHQAIGALARERGVERLLALGPLSRRTVDAFGPGAEHFASHADLVHTLRQTLPVDACLLIKGSLSTGMGQVVDALTVARAEDRGATCS